MGFLFLRVFFMQAALGFIRLLEPTSQHIKCLVLNKVCYVFCVIIFSFSRAWLPCWERGDWKEGKASQAFLSEHFRVWAPEHKDLKGFGPSTENTPLPLAIHIYIYMVCKCESSTYKVLWAFGFLFAQVFLAPGFMGAWCVWGISYHHRTPSGGVSPVSAKRHSTALFCNN